MTDSKKFRWFDFVLCGWVWTLLAVVAATLPLRNWDYWFHLTVGRLLSTHRAIPNENLFGYSAPQETPVLIHAWIGEYWLYELHDMGGLVATLAVRNGSTLVAWACIGWCVYRLTDRHVVAAAASMLIGGIGFLAGAGFAGPQVFVFAPFGVLAMLFVAALSWERGLWVLPLATALLTAFWVNAAPNFWAPAVMALCFAGAAQVQGKSRHRNFYAAAVVCSFAAMFIHPLGPRVFLALLLGAGAETWIVLGVPLLLSPLLRALPRVERTFASPVTKYAALSVLLLSAAAAIALQPWSDEHRAIPAAVFGDAVRQQPPLQGYGPSNTPVEAVEVLKSWGSQPRVYAAAHLSGYILYELQSPHHPERIVWPVPDWPPNDEVIEMKRAMESDREVFRGIFKQLDVRAVIVTPELGPIADFVVGVPDWVEIGTWPSGALYTHETRPRTP